MNIIKTILNEIPNTKEPINKFYNDIDSTLTISEYIDYIIFTKYKCELIQNYETMSAEETWVRFFTVINNAIKKSILNCKYYLELKELPYDWYNKDLSSALRRIFKQKGFNVTFEDNFESTLFSNNKRSIIMRISWEECCTELEVNSNII